ncbi:ribokinase, partial [Georgenia ruanii]|nr:ribokinase [Georgenia ruanii]
VVGSLNADLVVRTERLPRPGETVEGGPLRVTSGGKSANQAAAAALMGAAVRLVGAVGDDANGAIVLDQLAAAGVRLDAVARRSGVPTGTAVVCVDASAENLIIVSPGANGTTTTEDVARARDAIAGSRALGLAFEVADAVVLAAARVAREESVTTVLNPSPYRRPSAELLGLVDVLVVNEHELADMLGRSPRETSWAECGREVVDRFGVADVVVTLGAEGAVVLRTGSPHAAVEEIAATPVEAVDTTGCGDAFTGALLAGLASGLDLVRAARIASLVGAYAATGEGAQASYPRPADLVSFSAVHSQV